MNHHAPFKLLDSGDGIWFEQEDLTATSDGVAADPNITFTALTSNGDSDEDSITLANADTDNSLKVFLYKAAGNAADTISITPANYIGGTKITMADAGAGCILAYHSGYWVLVGQYDCTVS